MNQETKLIISLPRSGIIKIPYEVLIRLHYQGKCGRGENQPPPMGGKRARRSSPSRGKSASWRRPFTMIRVTSAAGRPRRCSGSEGWDVPPGEVPRGGAPGAGAGRTPRNMCFELPIRFRRYQRVAGVSRQLAELVVEHRARHRSPHALGVVTFARRTRTPVPAVVAGSRVPADASATNAAGPARV